MCLLTQSQRQHQDPDRRRHGGGWGRTESTMTTSDRIFEKNQGNHRAVRDAFDKKTGSSS